MHRNLDCFSIVNYLYSLPLMKKKITIIVTISFLLSIVGAPISLHLCSMQGTISFSSCVSCSSEKPKTESSCCEEENDFTAQYISSSDGNCCVTQLVDSSIKDGFLIKSNEIKSDIKNFVSALRPPVENQTFSNKKYSSLFDDSSPPSVNNNIYLLNSIFLI